MRKGLISMDALMAMIVLLFLVTWFQTFVESNLSDTNEVGEAVQLKAVATSIGTQLNAFSAIDATPDDFLNPDIRDITCFAGDDAAPGVSLIGMDLQVALNDVSYSYPVYGYVSYSGIDNKAVPEE